MSKKVKEQSSLNQIKTSTNVLFNIIFCVELSFFSNLIQISTEINADTAATPNLVNKSLIITQPTARPKITSGRENN